MNRSSTFVLAAVLLVGCAPHQQTPPPAASAPTLATRSGGPTRDDRPVYRFDFVVTAVDGSNAPASTSFTLNLQERDKGEMVVGKNVPLSAPPPPPPSGSGTPAHSTGSARQDVGLKVAAGFWMVGDDLMLDVAIEMSAFEPPSTIRKVVAKGNALATPGKPSLVTTLEDDHKRYQLTVTPTKLR